MKAQAILISALDGKKNRRTGVPFSRMLLVAQALLWV